MALFNLIPEMRRALFLSANDRQAKFDQIVEGVCGRAGCTKLDGWEAVNSAIADGSEEILDTDEGCASVMERAMALHAAIAAARGTMGTIQ